MLLANTSLNMLKLYWIYHFNLVLLKVLLQTFTHNKTVEFQLDRIDRRLNGSQRSLWRKLERCYLAFWNNQSNNQLQSRENVRLVLNSGETVH